MRLNISVILSLLLTVGLVAFGFTFYQSSTEKAKLNNELESRTIQVANEIFIHDALFFEKLGQNNINFFSDSINQTIQSSWFCNLLQLRQRFVQQFCTQFF